MMCPTTNCSLGQVGGPGVDRPYCPVPPLNVVDCPSFSVVPRMTIETLAWLFMTKREPKGSTGLYSLPYEVRRIRHGPLVRSWPAAKLSGVGKRGSAISFTLAKTGALTGSAGAECLPCEQLAAKSEAAICPPVLRMSRERGTVKGCGPVSSRQRRSSPAFPGLSRIDRRLARMSAYSALYLHRPCRSRPIVDACSEAKKRLRFPLSKSRLTSSASSFAKLQSNWTCRLSASTKLLYRSRPFTWRRLVRCRPRAASRLDALEEHKRVGRRRLHHLAQRDQRPRGFPDATPLSAQTKETSEQPIVSFRPKFLRLRHHQVRCRA